VLLEKHFWHRCILQYLLKHSFHCCHLLLQFINTTNSEDAIYKDKIATISPFLSNCFFPSSFLNKFFLYVYHFPPYMLHVLSISSFLIWSLPYNIWQSSCVRFKLFTAVTMKSEFFWVVTLSGSEFWITQCYHPADCTLYKVCHCSVILILVLLISYVHIFSSAH
jgi:hypothetical protein